MHKTITLSSAIVLAAMAAPGAGSTQSQREVTLLASVISKLAMSEAIVACERQSDLNINVRWATNPALKQELEAGAKFDVVAIEPDMAADLGTRGLVVPASITPLAKAGMALLVKAGAPAVTISDVEDFKQVLLQARAVSYSADGFSGTVFFQTLEGLGMMEAMRPKLVPVKNSQDGNLGLLDGSAQYYAGPIAMASKGMQAAASFPEEVQTYIGISAAVSARAAAPESAASLMKCLRSPTIQAVFKSKGYVPAAIE